MRLGPTDATRLWSTLLAGGMALALLGTACSGGSDTAERSAEEIAADPANAPIEQIDEGSGGVAGGPIKGVLTVQPSFGFGVWDVDRATGQAAALPGIASVETVDRNRDLVVGGGAAYALGGKTRPDQSFSSDVSVVKIDYETGQVSRLVALGFDRENDESQDLTSYVIEAVAGDNVIVSSGAFGSDERTYTVYDADSGAVKATFPRPMYEFSDDAGICSGNAANLFGLSDGRLAGTALGSPAFVDIETGEVELVIGCQDDDPQLSQFVTADNVADYAVFNEGPAPTPEQIERLIDADLNPTPGLVEGGGDLWWIQAATRQFEDVQVIIGGVVQFDLETGQVEAVHPLGARLGEYLDCDEQSSGCQLSTIAQADLRYHDGKLVILDTREDGDLMTLDPATGNLAVTEIEAGDGVDYTTANLLAGDPDEIWLEVRRFTITSQDGEGRSASGPVYIEHFDVAANQIDLSLSAEDLFF